MGIADFSTVSKGSLNLTVQWLRSWRLNQYTVLFFEYSIRCVMEKSGDSFSRQLRLDWYETADVRFLYHDAFERALFRGLRDAIAD